MIAARILLRTARKEPLVFAVCVLLQLFRFGLVLGPPLLIRQTLNLFQAGARLSPFVVLLLLATFALAASRIVFVVVATSYEEILKWRIIDTISRSALRSVLARPGGVGLRQPIGDATERLSGDTTRIANQAVAALGTGARALWAVVALALMVRIDAPLTAALVVPIIVTAIVVTLCRRRSGTLYSAERKSASEIGQMVNDIVAGAADIELAGAQDAVERRLRVALAGRRVRTVRSRIFSEVLLDVTENNIVAIGVGVMVLIAMSRSGPQVPVGDLALFIAYVAAVLSLVGAAGTHLAGYRLATISAGRLEASIPGTIRRMCSVESPIESHGGPDEPFESFVARGITYLHPGTQAGVRDVGFSMRRGDLVVVVGRVGAGKTTLLRAVLQLVPAQAGELEINGRGLVRGVFPTGFGYIPQSPSLLSGTIRENIVGDLDVAQEQFDAAIAANDLHVDLEELPDGARTMVGGAGASLSGGQVQRVAGARAHVREPEVYVVDDPSSALDRQTEKRMWRQLLELPDVTCLAVSSRRWILERADRILILDEGRLVASGPWKDVRSTYEKIFTPSARRRPPRRLSRRDRSVASPPPSRESNG